MKLTVVTNDLARLLDNAKGLAGRGQTSQPILQNVLLTAELPEMSLRGTDLQTTYIGQVTAMVDEPGSLCLPAHKLAEVAKVLPAENAVMRAQGLDLEVTAGATRYLIRGLDPAEYPEVPENGGVNLPVEGEALRGGLSRVAHAVSKDTSRPWSAGVLFEVLADGADLILRLAASDGRRMAFCDLDCTGPDKDAAAALIGLGRAVIVPAKAVAGMMRMLSEGEASLLGLSKDLVTLQANNDQLFAVPYEATFPDYDMVIPQKPGPQMTVSRQALIAAIKRVAVMEPAKTRQIEMDLADGVLSLNAEDNALGQASESLEVEWAGPPRELTLNAGYLLDACNPLASKDVLLAPGDGQQSVLITASGDDADAGFKGLIMPIVRSKNADKPQGEGKE